MYYHAELLLCFCSNIETLRVQARRASISDGEVMTTAVALLMRRSGVDGKGALPPAELLLCSPATYNKQARILY